MLFLTNLQIRNIILFSTIKFSEINKGVFMKKKVAVLMGSKSDLGKLEPCLATLKSLDIEHEVRIMSAHRTPEAVSSFVSAAESNGFGVIIAAAGAAAHLAGEQYFGEEIVEDSVQLWRPV